MKKTHLKSALANAAVAVVAAQLFVGVAAVSAAGYKLADKTGAGIAEFRDEIVSVKKEVDATMASLKKVVAEASVDPRKPFKEFDKNVPKVEDAAKKARKRAEDMKAQGQAYFKQWEKELAAVNNPEIRKLAEERRVKLQAVFNNIKTVMEPVRDQFNTWLATLKDLHLYLNNDLTVHGIDAAKDLIGKTTSQGQDLQEQMDKVIAELNTVVATVTPAKAKKK